MIVDNFILLLVLVDKTCAKTFSSSLGIDGAARRVQPGGPRNRAQRAGGTRLGGRAFGVFFPFFLSFFFSPRSHLPSQFDVNDKKSLLGEGSFGSVWKVSSASGLPIRRKAAHSTARANAAGSPWPSSCPTRS